MDKAASVEKQSGGENPFIYNAPVRGTDFFNRNEIMEKLLLETVTGKSQGNVWVTGERQVGKTSLLRYVQSKYEHYDKKIKLYPTEEHFDVAFIYLNVQDTKNSDDFYQNLRQSLKNFFDFKIETKDNSYRSFIDALHYLYFEQKYYIVFLVDEFDAFIEHHAAEDPKKATLFLAEFNKLIQGISDIKDEPKIFSCIFAANHTIDELLKENDLDRRGSGLVLETMELDWFSKKQVEELARLYLRDNSLRFSPGDIDFCYNMTLGYPYFVQKLFSILFTEKSQNPGSDAYLSKVKEEYGNMFKETVKGWGGANMPKRTLEKLKTFTFVRDSGEGGYDFYVEFIRKWIVREISQEEITRLSMSQ